MEVNMSPNITPTAPKYEKNAKIREKMIYDVVNLVGIGSNFDLMSMWVIEEENLIAFSLANCVKKSCIRSSDLIGINWRKFHLFSYDQQSTDMISNLGNIAVKLRACVDNNCDKSCQKPQCELCATCLDDEIFNLHKAHREQTRRGGFKRIFPSKIHFNEHFFGMVTRKNEIMAKWFEAKCQEDQSWCWKYLNPIKL